MASLRDINRDFLGLYEDKTGRWFPDAVPGSHKVIKADSITVNGNLYAVDGKYVVHEQSENEKRVAELLEHKIGGEILLYPRVNYPKGVSTPDFGFNGFRYDLKTLGPDAGFDTLRRRVKKHHGRQSKRFIIDVTATEFTKQQIREQVRSVFRDIEAGFVDEIVIIRGDEIELVASRA